MASNNTIDLNSLPKEFSFDLNELPNWEYEGYISYIQNQIPNNEEDEANIYENIVSGVNKEVKGELEDPIIDLTIDQDNEDNDKQRRFLSNEERQQVYHALLERSVNGKLKRNTIAKISSLLSVPIRTIQRIWRQAKDTSNGIAVDVCHKKTKRVSPKRVEVDLSRLPTIPLNRRRTLRSVSKALNISYGTLYTRFKEGRIRRHSNAIKPYLKDENKIARLQFCISMLDQSSLAHDPKFVDMYNVVHIDEKWFYMTKKSKSYYLFPEEDDPLCTCQSKNFITKVMFLTAIARARFDEEGNEVFSGKIGVFPLVTKQPALRRSRNRDGGTLETKPIISVTKEVIRSFLVEKVIPAIQSRWISEDSRNTIFIQQDNARTHVQPDDEEFQMAASQNGFDIKLFCQPSNSPDLNVLDLGFFSAIQALQDKESASTVDELIHAVEKSFQEYPTSKINHVFF